MCSGGVILSKAKQAVKKIKNIDNLTTSKAIRDGINLALAASKTAVKNVGGKSKIKTPRVIPIPKRGGILPLIPIFAGLSALGSLAGGAAAVHKAVKTANMSRKNLEESQRHNKVMEKAAFNLKGGSGLYLKPYKKGLGLYLKKKSKNL